MLRSHIGWPSPHLTDTAAAHGDPFGEEEIRETKKILGLPPDETFWVPDEVRDFYGSAVARGAQERAAWAERFAAWKGDRATWDAAQAGHGLPGWADHLPAFEAGTQLATRHAVNQCIDATAARLPGLLAGSADLTGNNGVKVKGAEIQARQSPGGIQVHYGIREHGMGSVMNGMAAHGGVLPVGGTFFVFSDYMRPAVRLAALSGLHVIYSWTHDSIGLGQDGPTHQPVEHLASLRAMPGLSIVRPADANETAQAWRIAVEADGPVGLVLTRQNIPVLAETAGRAAEGVSAGRLRPGRQRRAARDRPRRHRERGPALPRPPPPPWAARACGRGWCRSPRWDRFEEQAEEYRSGVFPPGVPVLSIEAGSTFGWDRYADDAIGLDHFGASAPGAVVMEKFGFTAEHVVERAQALLARAGS